MKKLLFSAVSAALILSGCTKDVERPVNGGGAIKFTTSIAEQATRVDGTQWHADDAIGVYMFGASAGTLTGAHASNKQHTTDGSGTFTATGTPMYYPNGGAAVNFAAYYPYVADSEINNYAVSLNVAEQNEQIAIDFMYAETTGAGYTEGEVDLQFEHKLAKLVFNISEANPTTLVNVATSLEGFSTEATFNLDAPEGVTVAGGSNNVEIAAYVRSATQTAAVVEFIVLPETVANPVFNIELANGSTAQYKFRDAALTLSAGSKYTYNLRLTDGGAQGGEVIPGEIGIDDWTPEPPVNDDIVVTPPTGDIEPENPGTEAEPYTVSDLKLAEEGTQKWVEGFIVGVATSASAGDFAEPFEIDTNILLADAANETNINNCVIISFETLTRATGDDIKAALNLVDNASLLKQSVKVEGTVTETAYGRGLANLTNQGDESTGVKLPAEDLIGLIVINEFKVMKSTDEEHDYVELYNTSNMYIDLSAHDLLSNGSRFFTIPENTIIAPQGFLAWTNVINFTLKEVDWTEKAVVMLVAPLVDGWGMIDEINTYSTGFYTELADYTNMGVARFPDGGEWDIMTTTTKGAPNGDGSGTVTPPEEPEPTTGKVVLNEIKVSEYDGDNEDYIELYYTGEGTIDLTGWAVADSKDNWFVLSGTTDANGFFTIGESTFDFGLSADGEDMKLRDKNGNVVDIITTPSGLDDDDFPAYARTIDGAGTWAKTNSPTRNASNKFE